MGVGYEESAGPDSNSLAAVLMEAAPAEQPGAATPPSPPRDAARLAVGGGGSCSSSVPALGGGSAAARDVPNPFVLEAPLLSHAGLLLADALSRQMNGSPCAFSGAGRAASNGLATGGGSPRLPSAMETAVQAGCRPAVGSVEQLEGAARAQAEATGAAAAAGSGERRKEAPPAEAAGTQPAADTSECRKEAPPAQAAPAASAGGVAPQAPDSTQIGRANRERRGRLAAETRCSDEVHSGGESRPDFAGPCISLKHILP